MMRPVTPMPLRRKRAHGIVRMPVVALLVLLSLLVCAAPALAETRAWLDRSRTVLGQPVVLNIESSKDIGQPDMTPLQRDFDVVDTSSSRQVEMVNGRINRSTLLAITLQPRRTGELTVPPLEFQGERTPPLGLRVADAPAAQPGSSNAYIETQVDDLTPYVQQTVGVTLRLFYAVPLVSGQLDMDPPKGTSLQRVGDDVQSTQEVNGRRYNVVERRFLLVPDRSGTLTLPAARFTGRAAGGGFFDSMLGMGQRSDLNAVGQSQTLHVQPQPDQARQPWLPVSDLRLRYATAPRDLTAGQASSFVVQATVRGATRTQLPDLPIPDVQGAQVFAEPATYEERFDGATPVVEVTRKYSLVPNGAGKLVLPGLKMDWWDVKADQARTAALPDMTLQVARGAGSFANATLPQAAPAQAAEDAPAPEARTQAIPMPDAGGDLSRGAGNARIWMLFAVLFALLWLLTLGWMLWRARTGQGPLSRIAPALGLPVAATGPRPTHGLPDLRKALDAGTLEEVAEVLRGMAAPPAADLDRLTEALADPAQRAAVDALRRARWADGDGPAARARLRDAFARGPQWKAQGAKAGDAQLPPLYPGGD